MRAGSAVEEGKEMNDAIKQAIDALEAVCGDRCNAEYNPCQAREAIAALRALPSPPPECQTESEKTAYAFGWWKALESVELKKEKS